MGASNPGASDFTAASNAFGNETNIIDQIANLVLGGPGQKSVFGAGGSQQELGSLQKYLNGQIGKMPNFTPENNALTQNMLGAGNSSINTLKANEGGIANPGAAFQDMQNSNQQNARNETTQLGGAEFGQGLQQQQSTLSNLLGITGQNTNIFQGLLGDLSSSLGGLSQAGNAYMNQGNAANQQAAQNNPFNAIFGGLTSALPFLVPGA